MNRKKEVRTWQRKKQQRKCWIQCWKHSQDLPPAQPLPPASGVSKAAAVGRAASLDVLWGYWGRVRGRAARLLHQHCALCPRAGHWLTSESQPREGEVRITGKCGTYIHITRRTGFIPWGRLYNVLAPYSCLLTQSSHCQPQCKSIAINWF